jgi:FAD/FMN-containing dehydrogenase
VPPYYVDVQSVSDVQVAYAFSLVTGVHLSIKNSGHDYKGRSSSRGSLSLWTHNLQSINHSTVFVPEGCPASKSYNAITVGAGAYWQQVYSFAEANNITAIGGYHQTIAASGGWLQGGGHSVLSPSYGLGVDRVVQFKVVTPDGHYRVANECQNKDLFWALRGGGGSTWGVVLETSQKVEPQLKLRVASIAFNQTATNAAPWLKLVTQNALKWSKEGWGGHIGANTLINVTPRLTLDQAIASLKPVSDYALSQNGTVVIEELPSWNTFFEKYVIAAQSAVGAIRILGTRLIPAAKFESEEGLNEVYNMLVGMLPVSNPNIILGTPFLYNYTQGSTSVTPAWRNSIWHLGMHQDWNFNTTKAEKRGAYKNVTEVTQTMRDISPNSGAYFNEGDVYEPNHEQAFWGSNYPRLLSIKKKYDPFGLLDCWQCVGWKGPKDPRYSCYLSE